MKPPIKEISLESQWYDTAQLLLSEKRTSLSVLRTGVGIFVLPLSVLSLLIATAKTHQVENVGHLLVAVLIISAFLALLAVVLIVKALIHLKHYDKMLKRLRDSHPFLRDIIT